MRDCEGKGISDKRVPIALGRERIIGKWCEISSMAGEVLGHCIEDVGIET